MKLSQELQPVLLELANLERSQGHGAKKEIPEQAEYDKAKEEHKRLLDASGSAQMAVYPTVDPIFDARFKLLAPNGEQELAVPGEVESLHPQGG